jgi:hypothetical protein
VDNARLGVDDQLLRVDNSTQDVENPATLKDLITEVMSASVLRGSTLRRGGEAPGSAAARKRQILRYDYAETISTLSENAT